MGETAGSQVGYRGGMLRRLAGGLVVFLGVAWLVPARAQACSCVMPPAPKEALKQSDAVFEGKVLAVANDPAAHRDTVKFEVTRVWKGELTSRTEVTTIDIGP